MKMENGETHFICEKTNESKMGIARQTESAGEAKRVVTDQYQKTSKTRYRRTSSKDQKVLHSQLRGTLPVTLSLMVVC